MNKIIIENEKDSFNYRDTNQHDKDYYNKKEEFQHNNNNLNISNEKVNKQEKEDNNNKNPKKSDANNNEEIMRKIKLDEEIKIIINEKLELINNLNIKKEGLFNQKSNYMNINDNEEKNKRNDLRKMKLFL